mgnify:CR=1 FL=1
MAKLTLTPQQQAVVENRGGSLLVSAAAGSGKTKVLVDRLFRYVTEERCNIDDFLIITYTKAAAAELRSKIASELSKRLGQTPGDQQLRRQLLRVYQADIKTVDAFCTSLLRENTHLLAREGDSRALTPDFRVLDDNEAQLIRQRVLSRTLEDFYDQLDEGRGLLADTLGAGRDDSRLAALVLELYDKVQSHADPAGGWRRTGPFGAAGRAALMTPPTPLSCWPPSAGRGPTGGPCSGPPPPGPRGTRRCTGGTGRSFSRCLWLLTPWPRSRPGRRPGRRKRPSPSPGFPPPGGGRTSRVLPR